MSLEIAQLPPMNEIHWILWFDLEYDHSVSQVETDQDKQLGVSEEV